MVSNLSKYSISAGFFEHSSGWVRWHHWIDPVTAGPLWCVDRHGEASAQPGDGPGEEGHHEGRATPLRVKRDRLVTNGWDPEKPTGFHRWD